MSAMRRYRYLDGRLHRTREFVLPLLATVLIAGLTACGSSSGQASLSGPAVKPEPGPFCGSGCQQALSLGVDPRTVEGKVGLSLNSTAFSYGVAMRNEAEDEVKKYFPNIDLVVTDGQGNAATQSNNVDNLVTRGVKVLLISPYEANALVSAIKRAEAAGVKVITVDRSANTDVTSYVAPDDVANGEAVGNYLAQQLGGQGKILEITGTPGASATIARHDGFMKAISAHPGMQILASYNGDYLRGPALQVMQNALQRFPAGSFQAVFTQSDEMAVGVVQALKEANRAAGIPVVGINGEQAGLQLIQNGSEQATAVYATCAREGIMAAAKLLSNESIPSRVAMDSTLITKDNAAQFVGKTW